MNNRERKQTAESKTKIMRYILGFLLIVFVYCLIGTIVVRNKVGDEPTVCRSFLVHTMRIEPTYYREKGRFGSLQQLASDGYLPPIFRSSYFQKYGYTYTTEVSSSTCLIKATPDNKEHPMMIIDDKGIIQTIYFEKFDFSKR